MAIFPPLYKKEKWEEENLHVSLVSPLKGGKSCRSSLIRPCQHGTIKGSAQ